MRLRRRGIERAARHERNMAEVEAYRRRSRGFYNSPPEERPKRRPFTAPSKPKDAGPFLKKNGQEGADKPQPSTSGMRPTGPQPSTSGMRPNRPPPPLQVAQRPLPQVRIVTDPLQRAQIAWSSG